MDPTEENVISLLREHIDKVSETDAPDIEDMCDLSLGLSLSMVVMVRESRDNPSHMLEIITPYLKAAYGLGMNRGKGENE